LPRQVGS
jgi:hypothetical protein